MLACIKGAGADGRLAWTSLLSSEPARDCCPVTAEVETLIVLAVERDEARDEDIVLLKENGTSTSSSTVVSMS